MLLGQAGSALGAQQLQCSHNASTHISGITAHIGSTGGHCAGSAAHLSGVGSSLSLGGGNDVVGSIDLILIQHADSGAGLQCADGAAGHSNAQVGSSQSGVHRAHSLACQHCHLCGGSIGVGSGQTGSLADAASHVIGNAGHKALGIHDGDHRHAEGIAQAHKAGSLGYAVVAQLLAGCHNAHGVAADGCKCGVNRLTKACVQLHSAVLIDHSGSSLCGLGTDGQNSGGLLELEDCRAGQVVGGQQTHDVSSLFSSLCGIGSHDGSYACLGGSSGAACVGDLIALGCGGERSGEEQLCALGHDADVCIMAEGAELFFTAPFTSAAKGDKVADAGSAAAAAKAGVASIVATDAAEAAEKAAHIVGLLPANNLTGPAIFEFEQPTAVLAVGAEPAKAAAAVIDKDSAVELYAGFGKSVYTAFATIGGNAVGVVATGKQLCHNCVAKASRFVRLCDAFSVPVVTIVDTEGFVPSVTDDVAGGIREAARLAATYADATTAKVAVLAGKAVGPVYTTLAAADLRIAVTGCTVSALEPSAAVSVLYKDEIDASDNIIAATKAKTAAYTAEVCSAASAVAAGAADMSCDAANVRASVVAALELLSTKRAARLPKKHGNMAL